MGCGARGKGARRHVQLCSACKQRLWWCGEGEGIPRRTLSLQGSEVDRQGGTKTEAKGGSERAREGRRGDDVEGDKQRERRVERVDEERKRETVIKRGRWRR